MPDGNVLTDEERFVLEQWGIRDVTRATVPSQGVMNRVVLIDSPEGQCVLRGHRHQALDRVACEHAVIEHARTLGVATPEPLRLPDGAPILRAHDRYWSLFRRARGRQVARAALEPSHAAAMGTFLRQLHQQLAGFQDARLPTLHVPSDTEATVARLSQLIELVAHLESPQPVDVWALERLRSRRDWLRAGADVGVPNAFSELPRQAIHGDYQESNLFFDDQGVSGLIDWDKAMLAPPAWELVRVLDLAFQLEEERCAAFLTGYYRGDVSSALRQLAEAALAYSSLRAHDLWLYETVYRDGNVRARTFITEGRFVPFGVRWAAFCRRVGLP